MKLLRQLVLFMLMALTAVSLLPQRAVAQSALAAGDIAIVGFNFANPDEWAFVVLVDIAPSTVINFTDNGVKSDGTFRTGEGTLVWTSPTTTVSAGTIIDITNDGGWAADLGSVSDGSGLYLSGSGDQIIAYQGDEASPTFIYALNSEGTGWQTDATSSNTSALPPGLTDGYTAVALDEIDNAVYNESVTSGTQSELLTAISNKDNWTGSNSERQTMPAGPYTVTGGGGDNPPVISNVSRTPKVPAADQDVTVTATVTDDNGITMVQLRYKINDGTTVNVDMINTSGDEYSGTIPATAYTDGDRVEYWVYAEDNASPAQSTESSHSKFFAGTTDMSAVHAVDTDGVALYSDYYVRLRGIGSVQDSTFSVSNMDVYCQDNTGGINVFISGAAAFEFFIGYDYTVVGRIDQYNGKMEIIPDDTTTDITDNGAGTPPVAQVKTIADLLADPETYEDVLIKIENVTKTDGVWPAEGSDANITVTDDGGTSTLTMRIDKDTNIDGSAEGNYPLTVTGIFTQYDNSLPYTEGYQIMPRNTEDLVWTPNAIGLVENVGAIKSYQLYANFPNPFNPSTTIIFGIPQTTQRVSLNVYDILGNNIATLFDGSLITGQYKIQWNGLNGKNQQMPSGVYFAVLKAPGVSQTIKMMLVR